MNPSLSALKPYPFERLRSLLAHSQPNPDQPLIGLQIGEPRHPAPAFIEQALIKHMKGLGNYPLTLGIPELRQSLSQWLIRRFNLPNDSINPETMVLPLNGTREGLFSFVQAVIDRSKDAAVLMPNPFYQIYEGAALLAGAEPIFLNTTRSTQFLPDLESVSAETWQRCQILFLCSPGNPTGAVMSLKYFKRALELADQYDFVIASDECYSDIYLDDNTPPPGLIQAAISSGRNDLSRCMAFYSLSKRSSVPGLRSGFVVGDPKLIKPYLLYRTYHGCAMPPPTQQASLLAWNDESHVAENRQLYQAKFKTMMPILQSVMDIAMPDAGFYLWMHVGDDERFTRELYEQQSVMVLPGSYLSRDTPHGDPGKGYVRLSLTASVEECRLAAERIRAFFESR